MFIDIYTNAFTFQVREREVVTDKHMGPNDNNR